MRKIFSIVLVLCLLCVRESGAWQIRTGSTPYPSVETSWSFSEKPNLQLQQARSGGDSTLLQNLQLVVRDGKTQQALALSVPQIKAGTSTLVAAQSARSLKISQKLQLLTPHNSAVLWTIELENSVSEELWIETGLRGEFDETSPLRFWDGYDFRPVGAQKMERSTPVAAFPATMLQSSKNKSALVIGLHPDNDISWITTRLDPQAKEYFYGGRFVIPAKQKVSLTYVLYALQPRFGELDAIDGFYYRFPSAFTATPGTDPRLTGFRGVNSSYVARTMFGNLRAEPQTRIVAGLEKLRAGWEWGYNTYKYSGDWYGRTESWELALSDGDRAALDEYIKNRSSFDLRDIAQFHRDRIAVYKNADLRANIHMSFYLLNFVQSELAQKNDWMKYTYGYMRYDDHGSGRVKHWVAPYDDTWHMFPWATPLEEVHRRDLPALLDELETSSFAIDIYADSSPYRGPTTKYLPGWSYDEKGSYINTGLANKQLVNFIHTLSKGKFKASVVANLSPWEKDPALKTNEKERQIPNYSTVFAPDAYIVEGDVSEQIDYDQPGRLFPKRYLFGKKYISSVSGAYNDKIGERIPWQTMSPNQIRAAYGKYLKKRVIAYYQGGFLPNYDDARNIGWLSDEVSRLLEVQSRGFSAAPASIGDDRLQRRRYGNSLGAAVVYSNPVPEEVRSSEKLLNSYFQNAANSVVVPFAEDGQPLDFSTDAAATQSRFSLVIPSMENRVVTMPIALQLSTPQALRGTTRLVSEAHQQTCFAEVEANSAMAGVLYLKPPRDFRIREVRFNGNKLVAEANGTFAFQLNSGKNQLQVLLASTEFLAPEEQYTDFDWKNFRIVVAGENSERKSSAAQILVDYATHYHHFTPAIENHDAFAATPAATATIVIGTDEKQRGVRFDAAAPRVLHVMGADDFDAQQLAWRLARLLDARESQRPAATFTDPSTKAMLTKIGLMTPPATSAVARPITLAALAPVPGEDAVPGGATAGSVAQLDFEQVRPLPRDNWTATASSTYVVKANPILPSQALDNVAGTRWTPGRGKVGAWFLVDMQEPQEFNHVRLKSPYPYKYFPLHYRAEVSDDGENWRAPISGEGAKDTEIHWAQLQKARYIRMTLMEDQPEFWSIDEFLVYRRALPQAATGAPSLQNLPQIQVPRLSESIQLDGKIDEAVWQKAATIQDFTALKKRPVTQATEARVLHDGEALYLAITCHEANMDKLWEPAKERDGAVWGGDDVEIYLSPGDREGVLRFPYYQFLFSPSGVQTDLRLDEKGQAELSWNAEWQVQTFKAADRWSAEVRIPFAAMDGAGAKVWRANIGRIETPNGDTVTWAPMDAIFAQPSLFGVWKLE